MFGLGAIKAGTSVLIRCASVASPRMLPRGERMFETSEPKRLLVSKRDAAIALSLSVRTVEHLIAKKELSARRVGRRTLVLISSLEIFARGNDASPSPLQDV